ncbi:iron-containing alcohol dehydrogenase family protein [Halosegnis marinus]|uniref:Iron-containing alcohol dehydrogenase family protein n=1 Tax=Halosegnis marinus TaxID=3034023 RepID=A0ABD5ZMK0_9EURY|nr:iron-containing alcohol dehydrogenase family protein [Halosegnis sp. DT85]
MDVPTPFRFEYAPGVVRFGAGSVASLGEELADRGIDRALVCCGESVGATPEVRDPVESGLGERHAATFAGTSSRKALVEADEARAAYRETDADAFLALGGGSALDVAKAAAVLTASGQPVAEAAADVAETGTLAIPDGDLPPVVAVPTTLAGADLSQVAGLTATPESGGVEEAVGGGISDERLMPAAAFYDPDLFAHTPAGVLAASAMNGFDKAVETLYARNATAVSDATAIHALRLCRSALPELGGGTDDPEVLRDAVAGIMLAQYGVSRPDGSTLSLIHAFGHGLTAVSDVQQGAAHGAVAPHALRYLFDNADGRRDLLAEGFGVEADDPEAVADGVVAAVEAVRDGLGLPSRLRDTPVPESGLDRAAAVTEGDAFMEQAPADLDYTEAGLRGVLDAAW